MEWADMGRHAPYVWGAYSVGIAYMAGLGVWAWIKHRELKRKIEAMWARETINLENN